MNSTRVEEFTVSDGGGKKTVERFFIESTHTTGSPNYGMLKGLKPLRPPEAIRLPDDFIMNSLSPPALLSS